jgi:hypothetical protein
VKILYGVTLMGAAKNYIVPKFIEMANACIVPHADVLLVGDVEIPGFRHISCHARQVRPNFAEDMLWETDLVIQRTAIAEGYDVMFPAGIDQLWDSPDDLPALVANMGEYDGMGTLQAARTDSNVAVCRRFVNGDGTQIDVPDGELESGAIIETGFPGFDTCALTRRAFRIPWWDLDPHAMAWYERVEAGLVNICAQEWLVMELQRYGMKVGCNTAIKTWHVHEDMTARMWRGIERDVREMSW